MRTLVAPQIRMRKVFPTAKRRLQLLQVAHKSLVSVRPSLPPSLPPSLSPRHRRFSSRTPSHTPVLCTPLLPPLPLLLYSLEPNCTATCHGVTCDDDSWEKIGTFCAELESDVYNCDCSGCNCFTPTAAPSMSAAPSSPAPTTAPSREPTADPSWVPTRTPTVNPSMSAAPTGSPPTAAPSIPAPSSSPIHSPTPLPSPRPTLMCSAGHFRSGAEGCLKCPEGQYRASNQDPDASCTTCPARNGVSADRTRSSGDKVRSSRQHS